MEDEKLPQEENTEKIMPPEECAAEFCDPGSVRSRFSRMGWFLTAYYTASIAAVLLLSLIFPKASEVSGTLSYWAINLLPMYCIGLPLAWLIIRKWKPQKGFGRKISAGQWLLYVPVTCFFMMAGNMIGLALTLAVNAVTGTAYSNIAASLATGNIFLQILFMVVIAPVAEELIFRKILISRLRVYGEKTVILLSAVLFGLYHGNLQQACYAFALGLVFGYIYNRTGDLKTSIGLHMFVNLFSGVLPAFLLSHISEPTLQSLSAGSADAVLSLFAGGGEEFLALCGYGVFLLLDVSLVILGLVLFCIRKRNISFEEAPQQLPRGKAFSIAFCNGGILVFAAVMIAMFFLSYGNF